MSYFLTAVDEVQSLTKVHGNVPVRESLEVPPISGGWVCISQATKSRHIGTVKVGVNDVAWLLSTRPEMGGIFFFV